jgi:hypothetical protein
MGNMARRGILSITGLLGLLLLAAVAGYIPPLVSEGGDVAGAAWVWPARLAQALGFAAGSLPDGSVGSAVRTNPENQVVRCADQYPNGITMITRWARVRGGTTKVRSADLTRVVRTNPGKPDSGR